MGPLACDDPEIDMGLDVTEPKPAPEFELELEVRSLIVEGDVVRAD